jgi:HNH endonuclease/NUMOD4 motif
MSENSETEIWRQVVGYEGFYEVSSRGRVRRSCGGQGTWAGRLLSSFSNGVYLKVMLSKGNLARQRYVHQIVAEAFLGPIPNGQQINHRDCNKCNNGIENLEYATPLENTRHAIRNGRFNHAGHRNGGAKLTWEAVDCIRQLDGLVPRAILARLFEVRENTISGIARGIRWRARQRTPDVRELTAVPGSGNHAA